MGRELRALGAGELQKLSVDELSDEISTLHAHLCAATGRWLLLVAEFDRREAHFEFGMRTAAHWLAWHCGIGLRAAQEQVRVARSLVELPLIRASFCRGELSYSKVRALSRAADHESEADLLKLALEATGAQLVRILSGYRRSFSLEDARQADRYRHLSMSWQEDGCLRISGVLAPDEGALVMRAIETARDQLWKERRESELEPDTGPIEVCGAEAITRVAETALAAGEVGGSGGDRNQVVVHVDVGPDGGGRQETAEGPAICAETARRLACDAGLVVSTEHEGKTLSIGRKTRTIPPSIRRALARRDRGCRFPGCNAHRFVDAHHVQHWADGGETSVSNLILLCRYHHRLLHEGGFTIRRGAEGELHFHHRYGWELKGCGGRRHGSAGAVVRENRRAGLEITETTSVSRCRGDRYDLGLAVEFLRRDRGSAPPDETDEHDDPLIE